MPHSSEWPPVLTIREPYIGAIIEGEKPFEFRSWTTAHRGPLLLHRGAKGGHESAIVAVCWIAEVHPSEDVPPWYRPENADVYRWAWRLTNVVACRTPIAVKGRLGLWRLDGLAFTKRETITLLDAISVLREDVMLRAIGA